MYYFAFESDRLGDDFRKFAYGNFLSATEIYEVGRIVHFEQMHARVGKVVDMQKFAKRRSRSPQDDFGLARAERANFFRGNCPPDRTN